MNENLGVDNDGLEVVAEGFSAFLFQGWAVNDA